MRRLIAQYAALTQTDGLPLADGVTARDVLWSVLDSVEQRAQASSRLWVIVWDGWDRHVGGAEHQPLREFLRALWQQQANTVHLMVGRDVEQYWAHRTEPFYRYGDYLYLASRR